MKKVTYHGRDEQDGVTILRRRVVNDCTKCRVLRIALALVIIIGGTLAIGLFV